MAAKLLLYQPRCVFYTMPLSLLAIASAVDRRRVEAIIVDGRLHPDPLAAVTSHLSDAVCLGITVLTGSPIAEALALSREVKRLRQDLPVVWGGWHPSLFPLETLAESGCVDIVVRGQGETTFRELVDCLLDDDDVGAVAGIAYRDRGRPRLTTARPLTPFHRLPPVDYSMIPVKRYFTLKGERQLDFVTSVGCHYRCRFCADPAVFQRQRTAMPAERVVSELTSLAAHHGVEDVNFQDDTFFTDRRWTTELAAQLIDHGSPFTWAATMRADQGARLRAEDFRLLRSSGLRKLLIGVEAGSTAMLERLGKDISLEQVEAVAARCREHDIGATFPFIFGIPGEEVDDVLASLRLAQRLKAMNWRNTTPFFFFKPYPGSELARDVVAEGYELPTTLDEWARFDFVTTSSPWVDAATRERVRRAAFYLHLGWSRPRWWATPVQAMARWRCRHDRYELPFEKRLIDRLAPPPPLA